ncbi:MAG: hypothetical protein GY851_03290 [bacterium]|nr:hypothetical protein [bacterium]
MHCWKDENEDIEERYGFGSDEWVEAYNRLSGVGGTCMLPADHEGEHKFTPDDQIRMRFEEEKR